jgi:hydrogenase expression/formation protein HypE
MFRRFDMEITMAHGAGGKVMGQLISEIVLSSLKNKSVGEVGLEQLDDGGSVSLGEYEVVISTDSYTVKPIFFPGGDIGKLAIYGTMNDISVMGAKPMAIASAIVLKEGFPMADLKRIMRSMGDVSRDEMVSIITGDTKVVERGALDGVIITTTGMGRVFGKGKIIKDSGLGIGDKIILTGSVGDHGVALMSFREGFGFETTLQSDVAPLWAMVEKALAVGGITAMKDPTRGGLAAALNEWAAKNKLGLLIHEERIPLRDEVVAASEMLGIDPFVVANAVKAII